LLVISSQSYSQHSDRGTGTFVHVYKMLSAYQSSIKVNAHSSFSLMLFVCFVCSNRSPTVYEL